LREMQFFENLGPGSVTSSDVLLEGCWRVLRIVSDEPRMEWSILGHSCTMSWHLAGIASVWQTHYAHTLHPLFFFEKLLSKDLNKVKQISCRASFEKLQSRIGSISRARDSSFKFQNYRCFVQVGEVPDPCLEHEPRHHSPTDKTCCCNNSTADHVCIASLSASSEQSGSQPNRRAHHPRNAGPDNKLSQGYKHVFGEPHDASSKPLRGQCPTQLRMISPHQATHSPRRSCQHMTICTKRVVSRRKRYSLVK
jgi:hypothetical protein